MSTEFLPKKTHRLFSYFGGMGKIMLKKIRILPVLFAVSIFGAFGINNALGSTVVRQCTGPCAGMGGVWQNLTGGLYDKLNLQARCNTLRGKCEYRCRAGYYDATIDGSEWEQADGTILPVCRICPENSPDCGELGSNITCCGEGSYMNIVRDTCDFGIATWPCWDVTCPICPEYYGVAAMSMLFCPVGFSEHSYIDSCYIPLGTTITDNTGTFTFESDTETGCNWDPDA